MAKTCVTQNKVTITFSTPEEIATLNLIKGITFSRSYKKGNHADGRDIRCALEGVL